MGIIAMAVLLGRQEVLDAQNVLQKQIQVPSITPSYTLKTLESLKVTTARIEEEDLDEAVVDLAEAEEVVEVEAEEVDVQDEAPDVVDRDPTTPPTLMEVELTTPPRREKVVRSTLHRGAISQELPGESGTRQMWTSLQRRTTS